MITRHRFTVRALVAIFLLGLPYAGLGVNVTDTPIVANANPTTAANLLSLSNGQYSTSGYVGLTSIFTAGASIQFTHMTVPTQRLVPGAQTTPLANFSSNTGTAELKDASVWVAYTCSCGNSNAVTSSDGHGGHLCASNHCTKVSGPGSVVNGRCNFTGIAGSAGITENQILSAPTAGRCMDLFGPSGPGSVFVYPSCGC